MNQILGSVGIIYLKFDDKLHNILTNHYNILCSHIGVYSVECEKMIITPMYENMSMISEWNGPYIIDDVLKNKKIKNNAGIYIKLSKIIISKYIDNNKKINKIFKEFIESKNIKLGSSYHTRSGKIPKNELRTLISDIKFLHNIKPRCEHDTMCRDNILDNELFPNKYIYNDNESSEIPTSGVNHSYDNTYDINYNINDLVYLKQKINNINGYTVDINSRIKENVICNIIPKYNILVKKYVELADFLKTSLQTSSINLDELPSLNYVHNNLYIEYPSILNDTIFWSCKICNTINVNKIIKVYTSDTLSISLEHKLDLYMNQLRDELLYTNKLLENTKETPSINYGNIIELYNNILSTVSTQSKKIQIPKIDRSTHAILIPNTYEDKKYDIKLNLGEKIILSSLNPNLDIYNKTQLREILIYLDIYVNNNPYLDELRRNISEKIKNDKK